MITQKDDLIKSFQAFREKHAIVFSDNKQQMLLAVDQSLTDSYSNQNKKKKLTKKSSHKQLVEEILRM